MFNNIEEIKEYFVKKGWAKNISFMELTLKEAEEIGNDFIVSKMKLGRKFFKMDITNNIYDDRGKIAMFNLHCC